MFNCCLASPVDGEELLEGFASFASPPVRSWFPGNPSADATPRTRGTQDMALPSILGKIPGQQQFAQLRLDMMSRGPSSLSTLALPQLHQTIMENHGKSWKIAWGMG